MAITSGNITVANGGNYTVTWPVSAGVYPWARPLEPEQGPPALEPALQGQRMVVGWRAWGVRTNVTRTQTLRKRVIRPRLEPAAVALTAEPSVFDSIYRFEETTETVPVEVEHRLVGLGGTFGEYAWQPGRNIARCAAINGPACETPPPAVGCGCGFWAAKSFQWIPNVTPTIGPYGNGSGVEGGCRCLIIGLVGLSGDLEECEHGWRASHARVLALWRDRLVADADHHRDNHPHNNYMAHICRDPYCEFCVRSQPDKQEPVVQGAVHYQPLGDFYQVPVFDSRTELLRYADGHAWTPGD